MDARIVNECSAAGGKMVPLRRGSLVMGQEMVCLPADFDPTGLSAEQLLTASRDFGRQMSLRLGYDREPPLHEKAAGVLYRYRLVLFGTAAAAFGAYLWSRRQ